VRDDEHKEREGGDALDPDEDGEVLALLDVARSKDVDVVRVLARLDVGAHEEAGELCEAATGA